MALSLVNKDHLGAQRVMNHIAQANPNFDFLKPEELLDEIEKLQATDLRIGGTGFGRGKPKRPLTPFMNLNMSFDPDAAQNDIFVLTGLLRKWSADKQVMWSRQVCDTWGFVFRPTSKAPNASVKTLVPLDPLPERVHRVATGRVYKAQRARKKVQKLSVQFTHNINVQNGVSQQWHSMGCGCRAKEFVSA